MAQRASDVDVLALETFFIIMLVQGGDTLFLQKFQDCLPGLPSISLFSSGASLGISKTAAPLNAKQASQIGCSTLL